MRTIAPALAAALAAETMTLSRCWKITRRDGVTLGFTNHDRDLTVDGQIYAALTGVEGTQIQSEFGFAVGGGEIAGALSSQGLLEADLAKGLWDGAQVEIILVNWQSPADWLLLDKGILGDIRRQANAFTAELRGLAHALDEERGAIYSAHCRAVLGDSACGIDLENPQWAHTGTLLTAADAHTVASTASAHAAGLFTNGRLQWLTGANAGASQDICAHEINGSVMILKFWNASPAQAAPGDQFRAYAGCDKQFSTCRDRFANAANFRGFPHMPGNDYLVQIAREGEPLLDGGSLFQ